MSHDVEDPVVSLGLGAAGWTGPPGAVMLDPDGIRRCVAELDCMCYVVEVDGRVGVTCDGRVVAAGAAHGRLLAALAPLPPERLGSQAFRLAHGARYAYAAGAMANGVASVELVGALGAAGILAAFGSAGLDLPRVERAIDSLQIALPEGPYAFGLIHSPDRPALEQAVVDLYLRRGVRTVEASAFMELTPAIVQYRAAGIELDQYGAPIARNRVLAKVSRREVAEQFLRPPPEAMLADLVAAGRIEDWQRRAAAQLPMADDVTAEADSGGHTDGQPLVSLVPTMVALRDKLQAARPYREPVRVGAAGGIATPAAVAAAFTLGADYVVSGSINQACVESGTSAEVRALLAQAGPADVAMAPAADMFELGVQVQVLKRGTLFAMRARRLYELYRAHQSLESIPAADRARLESELFKLPIGEVLEQTRAFLRERDPELLASAEADPRLQMALVFRWYLGRSSDWAAAGEPSRVADYQIWCGPSMGAFNEWAAGTRFAAPAGRRVADVAQALMTGAAISLREQQLRGLSQTPDPPPPSSAMSPLRRTPTSAARTSSANGQPPESAVASPPGAELTAEAIESWFVEELSLRLGIAADDVDLQREFAAFGLTSVQSLAILARLEARLGRRLSRTLVWNYPTIETLARHLAGGPA